MQISTSQRAGLALGLGALGVVFGDIGTSPLYALRECFLATHALAVTYDNVLGVLSLIFWSLLLLVSVKYTTFVLRADNRGEGGILALLALALPDRDRPGRRTVLLLGLGIFGAGLLYGDGMLTPSLTVLSAVEGLNVATRLFEPYVLPCSALILVGLFAIQKHGSGRVGAAFGPLMVVWFAVLAILGVRGILSAPGVLWAVNPLFGLRFLLHHGTTGFLVLGAVFLALTGVEALYADMGHFGARPIRQAWFALVLPSLFLNYLGQGALLLRDPAAVENPFYRLAPAWALYPLVGLATVAAVIASQALISGVFSLTMQATQLGLLPRIAVRHTSASLRGQVYIPSANWALLAACLLLVAGFGSSSRLAAAYGIAVSLTMLITTLLFYFAARRLWAWTAWRAGLFAAFFLVIESAFCLANLTKFLHGGWVPLLLGGAVFAVMSTWRKGRRLLGVRLAQRRLPLAVFFEDVEHTRPLRVTGTAVFMSGNADGVPLALLHNFKHNRMLHERNVFLTIRVGDASHVPPAERVTVERLHEGFHQVIARVGFMDEVNVPDLLSACAEQGLALELSRTSFFLSCETVLRGRERTLARWRKFLFAVLARNAQRPSDYFGLPPNRVIELGMQVEL